MTGPRIETQRSRGAEDNWEPAPELNELSGRVIAAAINVHRALGAGFLESVYEEALCIELRRAGIAYQRQLTIPIQYRGHLIGESRLDLLVAEQVVVEIKAVEAFKPIHYAQLTSYLRAGEFQLGLLINFNVPLLRDGVVRVVWSG